MFGDSSQNGTLFSGWKEQMCVPTAGSESCTLAHISQQTKSKNKLNCLISL